ncbi:Peptidase, M48 family [uncultured Desulfobacterium sp.]|uniref:Peptidase, M48 family n=1 Tax=uncultured Desulfobacterium sp. TaxID=201089 RepID=A0A445MZM3_9BACT|nr:Peptidase, M48 family [uncultured Desulfobacterium sp.]
MNYYLVAILAILIGSYLLDLIVDILNVRNVKTGLPEEFEGYYDDEKYRTSQEYLKENTRFGIISNSIMTPVTVLFIIFGGFNTFDHYARSFDLGPIATGLIFSGALMFVSHIIHLPFSIYDTFVIEEKYGFNKTTPKTFVLDILKSWLLAVIIGGTILSVVLWFFEKVGEWAWLYCWIATVIFQIFIMFIAPVVIMPIFNKFTPLKEERLKEAIESYADSQGFKMKGVYTMDGSKRSTKSNAFFTGFGRFRRIVLFDTLVERHSIEELVSVLAHEMGHYKKKHILKAMLIAILTTGVMFYILSLFINNRELFEAFKMKETSIYASLFFFGFLYTPIEMIFSIFGNLMSRRHEYEADLYAVETYKNPGSMISALKKLTAENLSNLTPHPLKVFLSYSHPPVLERIKAIKGVTNSN